MTQILGTGTARTSAIPKAPVVERKPAQVFFESAALSVPMAGIFAMQTPAAATGSTFAMRAGAGAAGAGDGVAALLPNPFTILIMGLFYSPELGNGELPPDQLYQSIINGQLMAGAFTRAAGTVAQQDYVPEDELRQIARQNGTVRTRVRFRVEQDPKTGEKITKSYQVGERSGLDRVRVRFAKRLDEKTWSFEDPSIKGQLVWSADTGQGRFVQGGIDRPVQLNPSTTNGTTIHEGRPGGYTTPPASVPESRGVWGLPNPVPEPLPPLPGTPIPGEQKPNIETLPVEDRDFNDFIIVDPLGVVPAIYVYFQKASAGFLETGYYDDFNGKSREGLYEVDHIPSKAAVKAYLRKKFPLAAPKDIDKWLGKVAAVSIPIDVHHDCSETYKGRNNRKTETKDGEIISKKELDTRDLVAAVNYNWDANAECLKERYGVSDEKIEEIRAELHDLNRKVGLY